MDKNQGQKGFSFVELLLIIAIVVTIGSYVLRFLFASELIEWENDLYKSIGLEPSLVRLSIGILIMGYFVYRAFSSKKKGRR